MDVLKISTSCKWTFRLWSRSSCIDSYAWVIKAEIIRFRSQSIFSAWLASLPLWEFDANASLASLSRQHSWSHPSAFSFWPDNWKIFYFGASRPSLKRFQLHQNTATHLWTGTRKRYFNLAFFFHISTLSQPTLTFGAAPSLHSWPGLLLWVLKSKSKLIGDTARSVVGPKVFNDLPMHIRQVLIWRTTKPKVESMS